MTASLIERMARAINPRAFEPGFHSIGANGDLARQYAIRDARAVLIAAREPSEGMEIAGNQALTNEGLASVEASDSTAAWQAMIDQALKEGE